MPSKKNAYAKTVTLSLAYTYYKELEISKNYP